MKTIYLYCEYHGSHAVSEAEVLDELAHPDQPWRCHAEPGCPGQTTAEAE